MNPIDLVEAGLVPDWLIRVGIRYLLTRRLRTLAVSDAAERIRRQAAFMDELRRSPVALAVEFANEQHYEVPAEFFQHVLGPRLKYSACYFTDPRMLLAEAETEMLRLTCERAGIVDGMKVLELGCGWGSLTCWMAEQFPRCQITAVSNSASQRQFIERQIRHSHWNHVQLVTADMCDFATPEQFDRIVSIEMFEHMRNYELLLKRVASWLHPHGKLFVHLFCHREMPYLFQAAGASNWLGRHFFTGGMMPSEDLLPSFADDLAVERQWRVSGQHYWRTCEAWLQNLDRSQLEVLDIFARELPLPEARKSLQRWRMFLMACAELFHYRGGQEWYVAHYLLTHTPAPAPTIEQKSCRPLPY